jgi:sulfonate transport system substrate-binding protein
MSHVSTPSISEPVELWYTRCGAATVSELAIRKRWVEDEFSDPNEVVLRSLRQAPTLELRNSHFHHAQSGLFREGGNIPPIWAKGTGRDTVVIGITWLDEYQGILVRADNDIADVADLRGKRLAIPLHHGSLIDFQRGAAQHGFATALSFAGLTPQDADFTDVDGEAPDIKELGTIRVARKDPALIALERGEVDAAFVRMSRGVTAAHNPLFRQLFNINDLPDPLQRVNNGTPRPITVDRAFLERHLDVVIRYLAVLLRAAEWAGQHREETFELLANENLGESVQDIVASHGESAHQSFSPQLNETFITGLEVQKNFLWEWGYLDDDFSVREWVVREPLARAHALLHTRQTV